MTAVDGNGKPTSWLVCSFFLGRPAAADDDGLVALSCTFVNDDDGVVTIGA